MTGLATAGAVGASAAAAAPVPQSAMLDRLAVAELATRERVHRDRSDFDALERDYHADAQIKFGWFSGTIGDYIAASGAMLSRMKGGTDNGNHLTFPPYVEINKDRALSDMAVIIIGRAPYDTKLADVSCYCRFLSRAERRGGEWRLSSMDCIYIKETIAPADPHETLDYDRARMASLPPAYRVLAYSLVRNGYKIRDDLYSVDQPARVAELFGAAKTWLGGA